MTFLRVSDSWWVKWYPKAGMRGPGPPTFHLTTFFISEHFHKIWNNFSCIIVMENNCEGFFHLSTTTVLRAKCWLPCLKDAAKLSPSLVFSSTFFIFYLLGDLFSGQYGHYSLLSKKFAAEFLYLFKVFHTVCILKVRIQFDLFLKVSWQLTIVISIVKNN